jgi:hypothetical protein
MGTCHSLEDGRQNMRNMVKLCPNNYSDDLSDPSKFYLFKELSI